jgi:hypothetical protein
MAVGDRRDAEPLRRVTRPPGDAVRVAGLDQVGSEPGEDTRDRGPAQRQAIAAAGRQRDRRQRRRAGVAARNLRNRDRMAPARLAGQPVVLGLQVAADAAAGRTPEHRRVDEVERFGHRAHCDDPKGRDPLHPGSTVEKRERAVVRPRAHPLPQRSTATIAIAMKPRPAFPASSRAAPR